MSGMKKKEELKSNGPQAAYEEWVLIGLFFSLWVKGGSCRTAPQRKREQQHQSTWNSSIKRGAENRQPNWILFWWVWIGGPAPRQLAKREDKRAAPTNQFKSNQLPLAPQEKESWWMNCLGLEWSWVVWVWVCFLLWINENWWNQFKCSAKEETSQTKQTQTEWKPAEPINHQLNKKRVALAALELFNWWVMGRSPSTAHQQQPKKENFLLLLCCLLWVCLH